MKILIVDDEKNIREGLKSIIPWKELGFLEVLEASDGEMAYHALLEHLPDICIMDIKMPKKDGVMVIESIARHNLATKYIILSGYGEFEYAKRLMLCGVQNYMLKPIDEDQLKIKIKVLQEEIKENEFKNYIISKEHLKNWLNGNVSKDMLHNLNLPWKQYQVTKIFLFKETTKQEHQEILSKIEETFIKNFYVIKLGCDYVLILKDRTFTLNFQTFINLNDDLTKTLSSKVYITLGQPVNLWDELFLSYRTCKKLIHYSHYYNKLATFHDLCVKQETFFDQNEYVDKIVQLLQLFEVDALDKQLHLLLMYLQKALLNKEDVILMYITLYNLIVSRIARNKNIEVNNDLQVCFAKQMKRYDYLEDMQNYFKAALKKLGQSYCQLLDTDVCLKAKNYIDLHYDQDIKAYQLAEIFGYNSAYFGQIFKEKNKRSIQKYIEEVRIEKSKEMLENPLIKVYEIASQCGFNDPDYFATKFKKYTGLSPNAFRKSRVQSNL